MEDVVEKDISKMEGSVKSSSGEKCKRSLRSIISESIKGALERCGDMMRLS